MYRKERRIPTLIALLIIFAGIGGTLYFDKFLKTGETSAHQGTSPQEVYITNVTNTSFTISWLTAVQTPGFISLASKEKTVTLTDDLDNDGILRPRFIHYITAKDLKEETEYEIKILNSEKKCFTSTCPIFNQKTPTRLTKSVNLPPIHGLIVSENNQPIETVVYLTIGKSATLSGRTDSSGLWVIPLSNLRERDLLSGIPLSDTDLVQIIAKSGLNKNSMAVTDLKSIRENASIPAMQIGKNYNFLNLVSKKNLIAQSQNQILGVQTQEIELEKKYDFLFPLQDEEITTDNQPRFRGIGIKGKILLVTVNSQPQIDRITVNDDGIWTWRPPKPLPPGTHQISIQGYDEQGNLVTVTRKFIVLKSGERVLGEATASATMTPTVKPSPSTTPLPTSIQNPTLAPNSPTPQTSPTFIPSPTSIPATATPPRSGNITNSLILLGGGVSLIFFGLKFISLL
jgi:hypothetical protein